MLRGENGTPRAEVLWLNTARERAADDTPVPADSPSLSCCQVCCGDERRPTCGTKACSRRRPVTLRGGLWLGTLRRWGPGWGLPGAPGQGPRLPGHAGASVSLPRWTGTNLAPHAMSLLVLHPPWTAELRGAYKITPHKEPGNGCILDLSRPPRRQLRRKLGAPEPGPWAHPAFPG